MFLLLSLFSLISFVLYFYFIGLWFFALIPLFLLVSGFVYIAFKTPIPIGKISLSSYSLYIAWFFIVLAIFGILYFSGITFPISFLWVLMGSAFLWIFAYFISYDDGKKIFQFGYYLVLFSFFIGGLFIIPLNQSFSLLLILLSFHVGFLGFFIYIVGLWVEIENSFLYALFISGLFLVCAAVVSWVPSLPAALAIISVLLTGLYLGLWWFSQKQSLHRGRISVRRILAGEKIISKAFFSSVFLAEMHVFIQEMPQVFRYLLEAINVLVVLLLFGSFGISWASISDLNHFFYWIVIAFFVGNVLVLKKIHYTSFVQNLFLFLVINFAVYVSLFSFFSSNMQSIVFWSVLWNIGTSLVLFLLPQKYQHLFAHHDYWYWIAASVMSFLVNVFLLLKTPLAGELIFFLLLLYVGIESMLVFYGIKHVSKKFLSVEDID